MRINRTSLTVLFTDNPVFSKIDEPLKRELLIAIDSYTYNLALVLETKKGVDALKYLHRAYKLDLSAYEPDLLLFLQLVATLNKRKEITQSDLYMLRKLDLPIENWAKAVRNTVGKMMFKDYYLYLDQNSIFKDQLTQDFYDHNVSEAQLDLTHDIIKWLEQSMETLELDESLPMSNEQLVNRFYQQEIFMFYHEQLKRILQIMNFQLRAFKLIETY